MNWREQFPIFAQPGPRLAYLDSAASSQKPEAVISAMDEIYRHQYANVHRGVHRLSQRLSQRYEDTRGTVARFINAPSAEEIIFTKGTTETLNLLAFSLSALVLKPGDVVLISALEHHANIVPWQQACRRHGATLRVIPMNDDGQLDLTNLEELLAGVKILSLTWVSNVLGTVNEVAPLLAAAQARGIYRIIDGAQAVAHLKTDVQALDCDFFCFSGHKLYGPTAVGVLWGRRALLEQMPVYQSGGDMILSVSFAETTFAPVPAKFEAGTPPIVEVIGLGVAIDWVEQQGLENLHRHSEELRRGLRDELKQLGGVSILGDNPSAVAVLSFLIDGVHPHDGGTICDEFNVALRVGQHCAEPLMQRLGVPATMRASFAAYNEWADVEQLLTAIKEAQRLFRFS